MMTPIAAPESVVDLSAWERFCESVARGGGVCDHPRRFERQAPASPSFFRLEVERVEHHQRNAIPFLMEHCGLAGQSVLEFGAGTGGLSVALAQAGVGRIQAVEPVQLNCETGRWRTRAYGLEGRIEFHHVPDTRRLPFPDGAFDAVVCSSVLQYIPDAGERRLVLTEMARVVRSGGLLIVCGSGNALYPGGPHSSRWWSNLMPAQAARLGHNRGISYWELNRVLGPLGFRVYPQGRGALERWRRCATARRRSMLGRAALATGVAALRAVDTILGPLTQAPLEAFLPYPDLAFRREATSG
jgi:ubiquinone/menaquinone biosynthesis C-methylase UbiE